MTEIRLFHTRFNSEYSVTSGYFLDVEVLYNTSCGMKEYYAIHCYIQECLKGYEKRLILETKRFLNSKYGFPCGGYRNHVYDGYPAFSWETNICAQDVTQEVRNYVLEKIKKYTDV